MRFGKRGVGVITADVPNVCTKGTCISVLESTDRLVSQKWAKPLISSRGAQSTTEWDSPKISPNPNKILNYLKDKIHPKDVHFYRQDLYNHIKSFPHFKGRQIRDEERGAVLCYAPHLHLCKQTRGCASWLRHTNSCVSNSRAIHGNW